MQPRVIMESMHKWGRPEDVVAGETSPGKAYRSNKIHPISRAFANNSVDAPMESFLLLRVEDTISEY